MQATVASVDDGRERPAETAAARPRVQSVARAIAIVLEVAKSDQGITTREISERVGIGRQATYHLLHTLVSAGMLTRTSGNRYVMGLRAATIGEAFLRQATPNARLAPLVRRLAQETGETAYTAGWWSGEVTTLSVARGSNPVHAAEVPQGYLGNAHARASGKLLLAFAAQPQRAAYLDAHPLVRLTPATITDRDDFEREMETIRERRYATDEEELTLGVCCLAVPLEDGRSPFVIALSVPCERFGAEFDRYLAAMRDAISAVEPRAAF